MKSEVTVATKSRIFTATSWHAAAIVTFGSLPISRYRGSGASFLVAGQRNNSDWYIQFCAGNRKLIVLASANFSP